MSSNDDLPVILVSATDVATASEIITELISDGTEPSQTNGGGVHGEGEAAAGEGRGVVWHLENKYYSASVRLAPLPDRPARPAPRGDAQAHLIYLTPIESEDESACARRAAAAAARLARGAVRLVGARGAAAAAGRALGAWARAAGYELVPLDAPEPEPEPEPEPFPEARGAARLREALHAHPWPGLVRRGGPDFAEGERADSSATSSDDSSWGSWRGGGEGGEGGEGEEAEARAVERAEQFAAALALLPGAAARGGGAGDAARRLQAEQLVAAFCRALGDPPGGAGGGGAQ